VSAAIDALDIDEKRLRKLNTFIAEMERREASLRAAEDARRGEAESHLADIRRRRDELHATLLKLQVVRIEI
jgi:hypothetical protein